MMSFSLMPLPLAWAMASVRLAASTVRARARPSARSCCDSASARASPTIRMRLASASCTAASRLRSEAITLLNACCTSSDTVGWSISTLTIS
ncbi:hypothetical protein D3C85_1609870 [compost metagenome]